jgi:hypothetical protein
MFSLLDFIFVSFDAITLVAFGQGPVDRLIVKLSR